MRLSVQVKHKVYYRIKSWMNYYKKFSLKESRFPPEVWIENTNCCNAQCVMCPRDTHTRKMGFMDMVLFEKLIKEIEKFNKIVKRVHLHNFGEPLLDKELTNRIRLAKACNIKHVYFVTNAFLLSEQKAEDIINSGLDEFKISFYGTDRDTYNKTMVGLDFEKTLLNVKNFLDIRRKMNKRKPSVVIQYVPHENNGKQNDEFLNFFTQMIDKKCGDRLYIFPLHNYGGAKCHVKLRDKISNICNYPWRTMVIHNDGMVIPCPLDYNGLTLMGDVKTSSIEEIWNGAKYRSMRRNFLKLRYDEYPVCPHCDLTHF